MKLKETTRLRTLQRLARESVKAALTGVRMMNLFKRAEEIGAMNDDMATVMGFDARLLEVERQLEALEGKKTMAETQLNKKLDAELAKVVKEEEELQRRLQELREQRLVLRQQIAEREKDIITDQDLPPAGRFGNETELLLVWARKNGYKGLPNPDPLWAWLKADTNRQERWQRVLKAHSHLLQQPRARRSSGSFEDIELALLNFLKRAHNFKGGDFRGWLRRTPRAAEMVHNWLHQEGHRFHPHAVRKLEAELVCSRIDDAPGVATCVWGD
jgi:hypothetical protein